MRVADVFMSVPALFLILVVVALFGASLLNTALVVGLVTWAPSPASSAASASPSAPGTSSRPPARSGRATAGSSRGTCS